MKIGGSYTVPLDLRLAYAKLQDPEVLARCMPGCERLEKIGEDEYEMLLASSFQSSRVCLVRPSDARCWRRDASEVRNHAA